MALACSRWRYISVNIPIINMISLAFLFVGIYLELNERLTFKCRRSNNCLDK